MKVEMFIDEKCEKTIAQVMIEQGYAKVTRDDKWLNLCTSIYL